MDKFENVPEVKIIMDTNTVDLSYEKKEMATSKSGPKFKKGEKVYYLSYGIAFRKEILIPSVGSFIIDNAICDMDPRKDFHYPIDEHCSKVESDCTTNPLLIIGKAIGHLRKIKRQDAIQLKTLMAAYEDEEKKLQKMREEYENG